MKKILLLTVLLLASTAFGQQRTFELKDASKYFDVKIAASGCDADECKGAATFSFFKKGGTRAYQVMKMAETYIDISEGGPSANETLLYDKQSVLNVDDFNFDGMEDVAISDGTNGSYSMPSFDIYLSNRAAGKFVYSKALSDLGHHLGMFTVDKKARLIETFDKSGCCYHITERYKVVNNRPVKVYVFEEDATRQGKYEGKVILTTKTLDRGRWKTKVRVESQDKYYDNH